MDNLFIEKFELNYSAKLVSEGFVYKEKIISEPVVFEHKFSSVLTIPHENGDILYVEETAKESTKTDKYKTYDLHFYFNTKSDEEKTSRMLRYLDKIFNINFNYMKSIHDSYINSGVDIGMFIKTGSVEFTPSLMLAHFDTSVINKKFNLSINNVKYNPVVSKIIKTKKIELKGGITQSFEEGIFTATFQIKGLFLDQSPHFFYNSGETPILVHLPSSEGTDILTTGILYTYFYDFFKQRINSKFLDIEIDLNNISQELFNQYVNVIDMAKI